MVEMLEPYEKLLHDELTLGAAGLLCVFVFQLVVFRWAERSRLVTTVYFLTSIGLIGAPLIMAITAVPGRLLSIQDPVVIWTLLSFVATTTGIACSGAPHNESTPIRG